MADALISPEAGIAMWVATAGMAAYSIKKVGPEMGGKKAPMMGVMGALVAAAQRRRF